MSSTSPSRHLDADLTGFSLREPRRSSSLGKPYRKEEGKGERKGETVERWRIRPSGCTEIGSAKLRLLRLSSSASTGRKGRKKGRGEGEKRVVRPRHAVYQPLIDKPSAPSPVCAQHTIPYELAGGVALKSAVQLVFGEGGGRRLLSTGTT